MDIVYLDPISLFPTDLPSNRIFGAICIGMRELYGDAELSLMLKEFRDGSVPFILSSAFPFAYDEEKGEKCHFFPKPIVEPPVFDLEEYFDAAKGYKKIKYLDQILFNRFITGEANEKSLIRDLESGAVKVSKKIFLSAAINDDFMIRKQDASHNVLNRLSGASENFYYTSGLRFKNSGLFFLMRFFDDTYRSKIMAAIRFIEDRGFGGDISSGMGQFKLSFATDTKLLNEMEHDVGSFITLSLYCPEDFDLFDKRRCWYDLMKIRGRCGDGVMKKGVMVFKEGSTFSIHDQSVYGKVVYVREDPDVVEYAIAFPIWMVGS